MKRTYKMKITSKAVFLALICSVTGFSCGDSAQKALIYYGMSDASAAIALSEDMFVVADDENNALRVYKTTQPSPVFSYDLTSFLDIEPEHPEADIEGAAMLDDIIYWITSHGRSADGEMRPNRYRFFAVKLTVKDQDITIDPVGTPCRTLVSDLLRADNLRCLELDKAVRFGVKKLKDLAPKETGLSIEAICASANGNALYIGFRNPRPDSKAIVVSLTNPKEVIEKQKTAVFADPILWDLKGFGIRSMEYSHFHKAYFIIAGPYNDDPVQFVLYRWSGRKNELPQVVRSIDSDFTPEAVVPFKNSDKLLLLSDDGSMAVDVSGVSECAKGRLRKDGKCLNKYLTDPNKKYFRAIWLQP
jgi:hypothetical protein